MIVAGERRWMAHRLAKLKKIDAVIRGYKKDFDWMIQSSIENYQREDVTSSEKEKDIYKVWKQGLKDERIKTYTDLAKIMGANSSTLANIIRAKQDREKLKLAASISTRDITDTLSLGEKDRKKILNKKLQTEELRENVRVLKKAPEEVKKALLYDKINVDQAERIPIFIS